MGTFSEITLSFSFKADTPDHVLAAFSALAVPGSRDGAPPLPEPVVEAWPGFEPDWRDAGWPEGEGDPFEHEPWRHDWASEVSRTMTVGTEPRGSLVWSRRRRWYLDCRFAWKTWAQSASEALAWLAPYVEEEGYGRKTLVGQITYESCRRPHLLWVDAGGWELEDLNPPEAYFMGCC